MRVSRAERVAQIRALQAEGLTQYDIALILGINRRTVSAYLTDPDGSKVRARKRSYSGTCTECGALTDGSNGRAAAPDICARCSQARQHEDRYWTRDRIIEAFQRFARHHGRSPRAFDAMAATAPSLREHYSPQRVTEALAANAATPLPDVRTVQREFGGWRAAIEAAGLTSSKGGTPDHRRPRVRQAA